MFELVLASPLRGAGAAVTPLDHFDRMILRCCDADLDTASERLGVSLPRDACRAASSDALSALWLGPDEWLLLNHAPTPHWAPDLAARLDGLPASLVDVGHRQLAISISGLNAEEILASGCALDLATAAFPVGMCARTMFAKAEVILWRTGAAAFHLEVWRSYARYVEALLLEAERELSAMCGLLRQECALNLPSSEDVRRILSAS